MKRSRNEGTNAWRRRKRSDAYACTRRKLQRNEKKKVEEDIRACASFGQLEEEEEKDVVSIFYCMVQTT
jgi:hypothetical protein